MKKVLLKIVKGIVFVLIFVLLLTLFSGLLIRKDEYTRYREFYSEKDDFDVLFFGSSRMLDAMQPMELWKDYGIKSYNLAQHGETLKRNYWSVENALKYNKPEVIVVDVSLFAGDVIINKESTGEERAYLHNTLDHMPLSITKIKAINDFVEFSERGEYFLPFAMYHNRWSMLTKKDFSMAQAPMKGSEFRTNIQPQQYEPWPTEEKAEIFLPEGLYVDKLIDLCREKDIEPIFICLPVPGAEYYETINSFERYFDEKEVRFINYWREEDLFDYQTDFSDDSHLNKSGALKVTAAMGEYLNENFVFDHSNNVTDEDWNRILEQYLTKKDKVTDNNE